MGAVDEAQARELLPLIEERRRSTVELIYESPALSLAAQAFLFVVALDPDTSGLGRLIAAVVGATAAAATALAILKHNYTEEMYGSVVDHCQDVLGGPRLHRKELEALARAHDANPYFNRWMSKRWRRRVLRLSATDFWIATLLLYLLVDLVVLGLAVFQLTGGNSPLT